MSSQGSPTLEFDVGHRRTERLVAGACVLLAAAAAALTGTVIAATTGTVIAIMPLFATIAASFAAAGVAFWGFRNAGWLGRSHRIRRIVWQADDRWFLAGWGAPVEATLRGDSRVGAGAAWLRWDVQAPARGPRTLLLAPGDVSKPHLRRLATRLRIFRAGSMGRVAATPAMAQER